MNLREKFLEYFSKINREGKEELFNHLEECCYFTAPSSSSYHGAHISGNFEHSMAVTEQLLKFHAAQDIINIPEESLIICGLFHDLGKSDYYQKPTYIQNLLKSGKQSESKPYKTNSDLLGIPHQVASIHILARFIKLTEQETFAILYHNGLYTPDGRVIQGKEQALQQLLHWADMWES